MGKLLVIEGLDGSGKGTQTGLLAERMTSAGKNVHKVSFPNYDSPSSALVKMYLAGDFGQKATDVNAYAASTFYAVDRYAGYKTDWGRFYEDGGIILADRYATSNAIHQCAKLPENEWDAYIDWLQEFEYVKMQIPAPDVVIYLDVDPDVSQRLLAHRYKDDERKKDIHEKDVAYLMACRSAALWCCQKMGWKRIVCSKGSEMRSIEDIAREIDEKIKALV